MLLRPTPANMFKFSQHGSPDNTAGSRQWLSYSVSTQSLLCVTCMAFGRPTSSEMWTSTGCSDWAHIVRNVERHETSADHQKAEICRFQWLSKKRLSDAFDKQRHIWNEQVARNRRVVSVMIDAIKYLAKEQMALRGHDSCSGKFYFHCHQPVLHSIEVMKDMLMAVEVWFLRRMLKISWTEKKSNE